MMNILNGFFRILLSIFKLFSLQRHHLFLKPVMTNNDNDNDDNDDNDVNDVKSRTTMTNEKYENKYKDAITKRRLLPLKTLTCPQKHTIVVEKTPLGNVLMFYNAERECFEYFSDHTIPFRFLEVVGRKFVLFNDCLHLFKFGVDVNADMMTDRNENDNENNNENDNENDEKDVTAKNDDVILKEVEVSSSSSSSSSSSVFANFKKYNKTSISSTLSLQKKMAQKNDVDDNVIPEKPKEPTRLQEQNRYSHQGKLQNYDFLKSKDFKKVDHISFAQYRKKSSSLLSSSSSSSSSL